MMEIPIVCNKGPMRKPHLNKLFMATRIRSVKFSNFMRFENETFTFGPTNFVTGRFSTGKSTIIMGILLALGQDDILLHYYHEFDDCIRLGKQVATIKLTVSTPPNSNLRDIYGSKMQITRKLLKEGENVIPCVWKVKGVRDTDNTSNSSTSKTVAATYMKDTIFPQLNFGHWYGGVPFFVTPDTLDVQIENSRRFWYEEFERLFLEKMDTEVKQKTYLDVSVKELQGLAEEQSAEKWGAFSSEYQEKLEKLRLCIQLKQDKLKDVEAKLKQALETCMSDFTKYYQTCAATIPVNGACIIDKANSAIIFAVDDQPFPNNIVDEVKQHYTCSSLHTKKTATLCLILTYWKIFDVSPIYLMESCLEDFGLRNFFRSDAFDDMIEEKTKSQFILTGYM